MKKNQKVEVIKKGIADSYDQYKYYGLTQYTGMKIGRSHKWIYDKGEWKETKLTPDLWQIEYNVKKRRREKHRKVLEYLWEQNTTGASLHIKMSASSTPTPTAPQCLV